jgi:hypothetical protein
MHILIDEEDLNEAEEFVKSGELVTLMNDWGLSINSMGIILNTLFTGFDDLREKLKEENK